MKVPDHRSEDGRGKWKEEMHSEEDKATVLVHAELSQEQIAESFLRDIARDRLESYSAGCGTADVIHPYAMEVLDKVVPDVRRAPRTYCNRTTTELIRVGTQRKQDRLRNTGNPLSKRNFRTPQDVIERTQENS
jgi:hypothetical protein